MAKRTQTKKQKKQRPTLVTTALSAAVRTRIENYRASVHSDFGLPSFRATVEALIVSALDSRGA